MSQSLPSSTHSSPRHSAANLKSIKCLVFSPSITITCSPQASHISNCSSPYHFPITSPNILSSSSPHPAPIELDECCSCPEQVYYSRCSPPSPAKLSWRTCHLLSRTRDSCLTCNELLQTDWPCPVQTVTELLEKEGDDCSWRLELLTGITYWTAQIKRSGPTS